MSARPSADPRPPLRKIRVPSRDLAPGITELPPFLYGRVLVAGLGLGWLSLAILERKAVLEVVTVEMDGGLVDHYQNPDPERHSVIEGDFHAMTDAELARFHFVVNDATPGPDRPLGWMRVGAFNQTSQETRGGRR